MFDDVIREAAARYGDTPLYVTPDGSELSYAALDRLSDEVVEGLHARGVGAGDVVALVLPSGPAYAVVYAAAAKMGAVTAGVNDRLSPPERRHCLAVVRPRLVVTSAELARDTAIGDVAEVQDTIEVDTGAGAGAGAGSDLLSMLVELRPAPRSATGSAYTSGRDLPPDPDRPVAVVFTSGTTGEPKGAVFTWRQLEAIGDIDGGGQWGNGGRGLSSTSFAHLGYMTKLPQALRGGGTTFIMGRWSAGDALEIVERHGITALGGIPTQIALMLRHDRFDSTDTSRVRMIAMGGGPSTAALVREARARFGVPVVVRYTCTEAGVGVGTAADDPPEDAEESVGRARKGVELTIRSDDDGTLPAGELGHVCLRSPAVMQGYWRDPDASAAVFTPDGAVRTGDIGYLDERGRLHLSGRSKEMYVRGGYNVYPLEVENVLADHPGVAHVAVIPRFDPVMGEIGVAVVVPRHIGIGDELTLEGLRDHGRGRLAAYKLPEALVLTEELPRTAMEKIDRTALGTLVASAPADRPAPTPAPTPTPRHPR
ncbi:MAG TPA: class I adenylate-forming enzyme family protein [Acidimicrobiales bacterium]|nr:class I adenylate-forming enzyme family protein [Acidimicrobiales bacterium]